MSPLLVSTQAALFACVLALVVPVITKVASSPLLILIVSPLLIFCLFIAFFVGYVALGLFLDNKYPTLPKYVPGAARPLAFATPAAWQAVLTRSEWSQRSPMNLPLLYPEYPALSAALNDILAMVIRDFVWTWYRDISLSASFPMAVSSVIHESLQRLTRRAATLDLSALLVKKILPKITDHVERFRQSEVALRGATLERRLTQSDELDLLLASRYASSGGGKLHPAIENLSSTFTKQTEEEHLRQLIDRALSSVLPEVEAKSKALRIVVREIVACAILYPVMDMMADPDFWNRAIDQIAGAAIHQQRLITKVRNVLEAQSPRSTNLVATEPTDSSDLARTETITIHTNPRQFESFLRSISRCSSLLDARRLKNDIVGEIRRTRMLLADHDKDDWINGQKTEDIVAFLDRLYTAKRKVEERIVLLGGVDDSGSISEPAAALTLTLRDILRNPTALSYFMEVMDRRHRSLLVQFWLTVESFKNPLESIDSGSSGDDDDAIQDRPSSTVREDISMINGLYFSGPSHPALACISRKYAQTIHDFALNEVTASPSAERKVRRSVMLAQRQVEQEMEQDFEEFQRSELWFRVISDTDLVAASRQEVFSPKEGNTRPHHNSDSSAPQSRGRGSIVIPRSESTPVIHTLALRSPSIRSGESSASPGPSPSYPRPSSSNIELLMAPVSDTNPESSRAPLFDDPLDSRPVSADEAQRMEAIQAALTDIIAGEQLQKETPRTKSTRGESRSNSQTHHISDPRKHRGMFDDEMGDDDDEHLNDDEDQHDESIDELQGSFQLAGPGDLQLSYEINRLGRKIEDLQAQDLLLDSLTKKAELTGDTQEFKLLSRSKASMNKELRELRFQKTQYEQQEAANRLLSDRTRVTMTSSTVGEEDGKSVVRYLIEVQQLAPDGSFSSGWVVARRYNEFLSMHNRLKEKYATVRTLDFPGKRLVTALSGSFVDSRRTALERYLQSLITIPAVCESDELRAFLSRESPFMAERPQATSKQSSSPFSGKRLVRNVYRSVAESIDDMFFGPSMLDVMLLRLTRQAAEFAGIVGSGVTDEDLVAQALRAFGKTSSEEALMHLSGDLKPLEGETSTSTFSAPICDLVLAVFELNKKNNWLRRQAIVIILQQVLGGTIERKIHDNIRTLLDESRVLSFVNMFRDALWPEGRLKTGNTPRTAEEQIRTRDEANRKLSALVPDVAANMIGRSNARRGARRIFAVLQNRRLNQHIAYTVLDEIMNALFPETNVPSSS